MKAYKYKRSKIRYNTRPDLTAFDVFLSAIMFWLNDHSGIGEIRRIAQKDLVVGDGHVDILINNAGIVGEDQWQRIYDINIVSEKSYIYQRQFQNSNVGGKLRTIVYPI